jgi:hypothetical protein
MGEMVRLNTGDVIFSATPSRALIFMDRRLIGSARDFTSKRDRYVLLDGRHDLRIEYPGYSPFETHIYVEPNQTLHLEIQLEPEQP